MPALLRNALLWGPWRLRWVTAEFDPSKTVVLRPTNITIGVSHLIHYVGHLQKLAKFHGYRLDKDTSTDTKSMQMCRLRGSEQDDATILESFPPDTFQKSIPFYKLNPKRKSINFWTVEHRRKISTETHRQSIQTNRMMTSFPVDDTPTPNEQECIRTDKKYTSNLATANNRLKYVLKPNRKSKLVVHLNILLGICDAH